MPARARAIRNAIGLALAAVLQLPRRLGWRDMIVVAFAASSGFTFALFFAAAAIPVGPTLIQAKAWCTRDRRGYAARACRGPTASRRPLRHLTCISQH